MLIENRKEALFRVLLGILAGVAAHVLLGYLLGSFSLFGPSHFNGFQFPSCRFPRQLEWLGVLLSFALFALFGAEVGAATLPFADGGVPLAIRSLAHFLVMCVTACMWAGLNMVSHPTDYLTFLVPLALLYVLIWLGRWVGWYAELGAIRERLGLAPGPSPLKWKETLPHLAFALLLCLAVPAALRLCDAVDVPVLSIFYARGLLPVVGFCSAYSLGKRQGFCPLYPLACGGLALLFTVLAQSFSHMDLPLILTAFCSTLLGSTLGAAMRWRKQRRSTEPGRFRDQEGI